MLSPIKQQAISSWMDRIDPLLEKMAARSGNRFTADHLYAGLVAGRTWLAEIGGWRGAAILKSINWPTGLNELEIVGLSGEGLPEWAEAVVDLERLARELNFHRLTAPHARPGWEKYATKYGWRKAGIILERNLYDG